MNALEMTEHEAAKLQSKSLIWFEHRAVRITALKFGTICHTSITSPSSSIVQQIMTVGGNVNYAAFVWGIQKEKIAVQHLQQEASPSHILFELKFTGLQIILKSPHLGASPDGQVLCECCGEGLLETTCPYSI